MQRFNNYFLILGLLLLTANTVFAQTSITENFESESNNATAFSESGFSFATTGQLHVENFTNYGVGPSNQYLDVSNYCTGSNAPGLQGGFYITSGGDIIIDSIYIFPSNGCITWNAGTIILRGYNNGSLVTSSTQVITSSPAFGTYANLFTKVTQPFGTSSVDSVTFTANSPLNYVAVDNITFRSAAVAPSISSHPPNRTICAGNNTTFSITASNATSYQWQVSTNGGSTYSNLGNTGVYSNVTTATMSITSATSGMNNYRYRCIATGSTSPAATSNAGTLTVNDVPSISSHPASSATCLNTATTFTVTANNATSYNWQRKTSTLYTPITSNTSIQSGVFTNTLTVTPPSTTYSIFEYRCEVSNSCGSVYSNGAQLTVNTAPSAIISPNTRTICEGGNTTFGLNASGTALTYQWQVSTNSGATWSSLTNTGIYTGTTTSTLSLTGVTSAANSNRYRCIVNGTCSPPDTSDVGTLTVNEAPVVTVDPSNSAICTGNNTSFSIVATGAGLYYQWQVSTNSGASWSNLTNTGIYTGAGLATLNLTAATTAENSNLYRCIVNGTCSPPDTSAAATLTVDNTISITSPNVDDTSVCANGALTGNFTLGTSSINANYGWFVSTNGGASFTQTVFFGSSTYAYNPGFGLLSSGDLIYCVASNACNSVTSDTGTYIVIGPPNITTHPANSSIASGASTSFTAAATGTGLSYQWQVSTNGGSTFGNITNGGIYSNAATATLNITSATLANNNYQYRCVITESTCTQSSTTNAATLTVAAPAPVINTNPGNSSICIGTNTSFVVSATNADTYNWQESTNGGTTWSNLANGGVYSGVATNTLNLTSVTSGMNSYQYRCIAINTTYSTRDTSTSATLTVLGGFTAALVNDYPEICVGNDTSFTALVTGSSTYSYQWRVSTNYGSTWSNVTNTGFYSGATTATLAFTSPPTSAHAYFYTCVITDACSITSSTDTGFIGIYTLPAITAQPSNATACETTNTSFSVGATGAAVTYQWEVNTGSGWSSVANGGIYSGATTNTLALTGVIASMNTYQYRCIVSGFCSPSVTTTAASLTVDTAPLITGQPSNSIICSGDNTTFSVTATGTGLAYQWQVNSGSGFTNISNGGIYSNATTSTLNLTGATTSVDGYQYRCVVTGTCAPSQTSTASTLTIYTAPAITSQPSNVDICPGGNASYTVAATGHGLTYQWEVNTGSTWTNLTNVGIYSNVTTSTLNITGATLGNISGVQYRCIINGTCTPSVTTNVALLNINNTPTVITGQPTSSNTCQGANTSFAITATGSGLSYQWQVSTNSGSSWANLTNTGIYTNVTTSSLTLTGVSTPINGYQYRCVVSSTCNAPETSNAATLNINTPPVVTTQPGNTTVCDGDPYSFTVAATGTGLSYQWNISTNGGSSWTIPGGVTSTLPTITIPSASSSQNGWLFRCVVNGTCSPGAISSSATLTVNTLPVVTAHPNNSTICAGGNTSFSVTATGTGLSYQWQIFSGSWTTIVNGGMFSGQGTSTLNITGAPVGANGTMYRCIVSGTCTPNATSNSATLTIDTPPAITSQPNNSTICTGDNTSFSIAATGTGLTYQWQTRVGSGAAWSGLSNGGIYSNATTNTLTLTGATAVHNGYEYRCIVSGTCTPTATTNAATLTINTPPAITSQPAGQTICEGDNTGFTVNATGAGLTYQWQESSNGGSTWSNLTNGGIYSTVTTSALTLTAVPIGYNGYQYRCVITGTCTPNVTTNAVTLTINTLPVIVTDPPGNTICEYTNTSYSITATGTALTYQWQVKSQGVGTFNNVANSGIYSGATTATLILTNATYANHNDLYRCVVSGACTPSVTSSQGHLLINVAPVITTQPSNSTICETTNTSFSVAAVGTALTYQWQVNDGTGWANISNGGFYSNATTNTLNITGAAVAIHSYQYRCVVSGTCTPSATSNAATITIDTAPVITSSGSNSTICTGDNTSFAITAIGTGLSYQWQVSTNSGASWNNLTNTGIYTNVTTATLNLTAATATVNGYQYRCVVNGTCTPSATSTARTLTINTRPAVTSHPTPKTICEGNNTTFGITATGTAITYQWQVNYGSTWVSLANGTSYSGVNTNTLTVIAAAQSLNGGNYRCMVNGACTPTAFSNTALLTINTAPVITLHPVGKTVCQGQNAAFFINATGTNLSYQWQVSTNSGSSWANVTNSTLYSGATTRVLNLTNIPPANNNYEYRCVVSGTCPPTQTSSSAKLTVHTNVVLQSQTTGSFTICSGDNMTFNAQATGTGVSYQWYILNGSQYVQLNNGGVYSGATTGTLSITNITAAPAAKTYSYFCKVTGTCSALSTTAVYLTVRAKPAITNSPSSVTVCDSTNNIDFNVAATGTNLNYQWQVNTGTGWTNQAASANVTGTTTPQLHFNQIFYAMNNYQYRCVVSGSCAPSVVSATAKLTVNPLLTPSVTIAANSTDICVNESVTFTPTPTNGGTNPTYIWKKNNVNVATGSSYTSTSFAHNDIISCQLTSNAVCPSPATVQSNQVTMTVHQRVLPTIAITSDRGTSWCSGKPATYRAQTTFKGAAPVFQWKVNGNNVGTNDSVYTAPFLVDGDEVECELTSNYRCATPAVVGSNKIKMTIIQTTRSSIVIAPNPDSVVCEKANVTMYAAFTNGGATPAFQWMLNGKDIPGETMGTLSTTSLVNGDTIACRFISSAVCVFPEISNTISFDVNNLLSPDVTVSVSFLGDDTYMFTAIPVNGGANPKYHWFKNGTPIAGATQGTYTVKGLAAYDKIYVQMVSSEPCVQPSLQTVLSRIATTGISEVDIAKELNLYPNPNNGSFTIKGELYSKIGEKMNITVVNSFGQVVFDKDVEVMTNDFEHTIQLSDGVAQGSYLLRISYNGQQQSRRFVIFK